MIFYTDHYGDRFGTMKEWEDHYEEVWEKLNPLFCAMDRGGYVAYWTTFLKKAKSVEGLVRLTDK